MRSAKIKFFYQRLQKNITLAALTFAVSIFSSNVFADKNPVPLFAAAAKGNVVAIDKAINSGIDVNSTDPDGWTPLMVAASSGKFLAVKTLLMAGSDVNVRTSKGQTPLIASVLSGDAAIVKLLLDSGADPSATTPQGATALDYAKQSGKASIITLLASVTVSAPSNHVTTSPKNSKVIDAKIEQAAQAFKTGDFQGAITLFTEVTKLNPKDALVWHFLGQSLAKKNDVMGARLAFAKTLEIQPNGTLAERTRNMLAKLPEPDLFTLKIDDALTLGDWMPIAERRVAQGKQSEVLQQTEQYLHQFGPVPQLQRLQSKLVQERQAQQERELQQSLSAIKVKDAKTAQIALPQIRQLKQQYPGNLKLLMLEASACHLAQDFKCANDAYSAWLKAASGDQPGRKRMVDGLVLAKQGLPLLHGQKMLPELPIEIDTESRQLLENSEVFQNWPDGMLIAIRMKNKDKSTTDFRTSHSVSETRNSSSIEPMGNGVFKYEHSYYMSMLANGKPDTNQFENHTQNYIALGGFVDLGGKSYNVTAFKNGTTQHKPPFSGQFDTTTTTRLKSITGTLFPLGSGAVLTIQTESESVGGSNSSTKHTKKCKSTEKIAANSLHPKLNGDAYKIECSNTMKMNYDGKEMNNDSDSEDYFIESLGVFASTLGAYPQVDTNSTPTKIKFIFPPENGTSTSVENAHGTNGMTQNHSYDPVDLAFVTH